MTDFDIAISFAGEDRALARQLAHELKNKGLIVFYDDDEQASLLGETLTEYLIDIYKNRASYCVVLVSSHYIRKRWTRHEWKAAQARAFEQFDKAYILPVRLDKSELPGLLPTIGYLSLESRSVEHVAEVLYSKVAESAHLNQILRLASAAFERADFRRARDLLADPVLEPQLSSHLSAMRLLAHSHLSLGEVEEARRIYFALAEKFPEDADTWFFLGVSHFRLGRFREAVRFYEQALELSPHHQTAFLDRKLAKLWSLFENVPFLRNLIVQNVPATKHLSSHGADS